MDILVEAGYHSFHKDSLRLPKEVDRYPQPATDNINHALKKSNSIIQAYYVDKHSIFKFSLGSECIHYTRRISEEEGKIQFKRALNSLEVAVLYAQDAKSKGKVEKPFDYFQRRLPQECKRY